MQKVLLLSGVLACVICKASALSLLEPSSRRHHVSSSDHSSTLTRSHFIQQTLLLTGVTLLLPLSANAMITDPKTGVALPSPGEIESAIPSDWTDFDNPFTDGDYKSQFARLDSTPDSLFYFDPRFVEHVDENAVKLLTNYISKDAIIRPDDTVLDLCSSWTSHIDSAVIKPKIVVGLGMNERELEANPSLTSWNYQDLNANPKLPYPDSSFSVVLCQLSIDYLTQPLAVLKEVGRVLQPGGTVHILFSNRLFLSKVSLHIGLTVVVFV